MSLGGPFRSLLRRAISEPRKSISDPILVPGRKSWRKSLAAIEAKRLGGMHVMFVSGKVYIYGIMHPRMVRRHLGCNVCRLLGSKHPKDIFLERGFH